MYGVPAGRRTADARLPHHGGAFQRGQLTYSFYDGGLDFNGTIPITGATGTYSVPIFAYYHSFNFFGRSANINASLPYGVGSFSGKVLGANRRFTAPACWTLAPGWPSTSRAARAIEAKQFASGARR